jgi:hypothetical protein
MKTILKYLLHTVIIFIALLAVAFLTRVPALNNSGIYALHAILVAVFNSAIVAFYLGRFKKVVPYISAVVLLAGFLAMMQPMMALGFLLPLLISLCPWFLLRNSGSNRAACITAAVFGALPYPSLVVAATLAGSLMGIAPFTVILWSIVSCGLGFLGALAGLFVERKTRAGKNRLIGQK